MKRYYVYALLDSSKPGKYIYGDLILDFEPFYIGKGTCERIDTTLYHHNAGFKRNKIEKLKRNNIQILNVIIFNNLEEEESFEKEIEIIKDIGRREFKNGPLVNQTDGGDGRTNIIVSEKTRKKISESTKKYYELNGTRLLTQEEKDHLREVNMGEKNPMFGKTHSDLVSGIGHPMYEKHHSEETRQKIKENMHKAFEEMGTSVEKRAEATAKLAQKKVQQFDNTGKLLAEFDSIKIASEKTGFSKSFIGKHCRGFSKTTQRHILESRNDYIFKFKEEKDKVLRNSFVYKVGDVIEIKNERYILEKRLKKSCIFSKNNEFFTFRKKDYPFLWNKKTIN